MNIAALIEIGTGGVFAAVLSIRKALRERVLRRIADGLHFHFEQKAP